MESRIGWLGGADNEPGIIDETLVSVDTYTGEMVRLTAEQLDTVRAYEKEGRESLQDLTDWLGAHTPEEAEAFLSTYE